MGGVKRIFNNKSISLRACRGNEIENDTYCTKDGKYNKLGDGYIVQGQRTDLEQIKKKIDDGCKMIEVANDHFGDFIRYHSGLFKYKQLIEKEKRKEFRQVNVEVIWGKTGTGKTKKAVEKDPNYYKIEGKNLNWWDGYEGEKTLIIDEYDNDVNITQMLNILDGYQLRLAIKGGFTYANWTKVIITSNINPINWHQNAKDEHKKALMRRITKINNCLNI